jgi:hypothetical protein
MRLLISAAVAVMAALVAVGPAIDLAAAPKNQKMTIGTISGVVRAWLTEGRAVFVYGRGDTWAASQRRRGPTAPVDKSRLGLNR